MYDHKIMVRQITLKFVYELVYHLSIMFAYSQDNPYFCYLIMSQQGGFKDIQLPAQPIDEMPFNIQPERYSLHYSINKFKDATNTMCLEYSLSSSTGIPVKNIFYCDIKKYVALLQSNIHFHQTPILYRGIHQGH